MGENTKIEWAHHTFNPWRGCTKVSPGCANCYAATFSKRNPGTLGVWGDDGTRILAADAQYARVLKWDKAAEEAGERHRVFCASLADIFEDWQGPLHHADGHVAKVRYTNPAMSFTRDMKMDDVRKIVFELIDNTPNLDWLLVTKRPENIAKMWPTFFPGGYIAEAGYMNQSGPRPNVWLLTSVENQEQADKRIPELLKCRDLSPVLGLSCEPLLGPVEIVSTACGDMLYSSGDDFNPGSIDWVIVGGESGRDARPMHPDWARSLRDQCQSCHDGIPFFFKQWGEWSPLTAMVAKSHAAAANQYQSLTFNSHEQTWRTPPRLGETAVYKVGKKIAGRLLDGLTHDEFPRGVSEVNQ